MNNFSMLPRSVMKAQVLVRTTKPNRPIMRILSTSLIWISVIPWQCLIRMVSKWAKTELRRMIQKSLKLATDMTKRRRQVTSLELKN
jgi:hypothetical protein